MGLKCCLKAYFLIAGLIWSEIKQLWEVGLREYVSDMWNVVDFVTNSLYVATIALRIVAYYKVWVTSLIRHWHPINRIYVKKNLSPAKDL